MQDGICLWHEGGGVCHILSGNKTVWTKNVRFEEAIFPAKRNYGDISEQSDDLKAADYDGIPESTDSYASDYKQVTPSESEVLLDYDTWTHIPVEARHFDITDDEDGSEYSQEVSDGNNQNSTDGADEATGGPYHLRARSTVDYRAMAILDIARVDDEPNLSPALNSSHRNK